MSCFVHKCKFCGYTETDNDPKTHICLQCHNGMQSHWEEFLEYERDLEEELRSDH